VFYLLLIAFAITGQVLPEGNNRFYVFTAGKAPMVVLKQDEKLWDAKMMDHENLNYIPQGLFYLNDLVIGNKRDGEFEYYDISEILSITSVRDLTRHERFDVEGGQINVIHNYEFDERFKGIQLIFSPDALTTEDYSLSIAWEKEPNGEMLLPESQHRKLSEPDIAGLSKIELRVARNEIFARHGYIFKSKELNYHFSGTSWYKPKSKDVTLSDVEQYNVGFLKKHELAERSAENTEPKPTNIETTNQEKVDSDVPCTCIFNQNRLWNPEKIRWHGVFWECANYRDDGTCSQVQKVEGAVVE